MTITLAAEKRDGRGKQLKKLRNEGGLPAVVYGAKHEAIAVTLKQNEFEKVYKAAGESTIIDLTGVDKEAAEVLVHEVAYDPVSGQAIHVDFYAIEKGKKLQVNVPLEFVGEAPAIKLGGVVTKVLHEVEVESLPRSLPHEFVVDLSVLTDLDSHILIKDLNVPEGVEILAEQDETVATVSEVEEEPEEPVEAVDMDAIEVEEKGKKDDEGESDGEPQKE